MRAFLGFVVAALAASSALKGHSKLHISMIRTSTVVLTDSDSAWPHLLEVLARNGLQHEA